MINGPPESGGPKYDIWDIYRKEDSGRGLDRGRSELDPSGKCPINGTDNRIAWTAAKVNEKSPGLLPSFSVLPLGHEDAPVIARRGRPCGGILPHAPREVTRTV